MKSLFHKGIRILIFGLLAGCAAEAPHIPAKPEALISAYGPLEQHLPTVRIGGEEGAIDGFVLPVKGTFDTENHAELSIIPSPQGQELVELEQGRVDAVVTTQSVPRLVAEAARQKLPIDPAGLQQFEVGRSDTVVFLNRTNHVRKLSRKQLQAIFTGKLSNWRQAGGANRPIVVVWNAAAPGENELFVKQILQGAAVGGKVHTVESFEAVRSDVMSTPGAIGIAPQGFMAKTVNVPRTPLVEAQVILVTRGAPSPELKKLLELLKDAQFIQ